MRREGRELQSTRIHFSEPVGRVGEPASHGARIVRIVDTPEGVVPDVRGRVFGFAGTDVYSN